MGKYNDVIKIFAESYLESNKFEIEGMEYVCELTPENELNVYINNPHDLSYSRAVVTGFFDELIDEFTKFLPKEKSPGPSAYFYMTKLVNYYTDISKHEVYISPKDKTELLKIANDIKDYYNLLLSKNLILEITTPSVYFTPLTSLSSTGSINLFFTLFANDIIDETTRNEFIQYISSNLLGQTLPQTTDKVRTSVNSVVGSFNEEKNAENSLVNNTFNSNEYKFFKEYNPQVNNVSIKGKNRDFTFTSIGASDIQKSNLSDVYKNVNINNDNSTYNGKKYFN